MAGAAINLYRCEKCSTAMSGCAKCTLANACYKCEVGMGLSST